MTGFADLSGTVGDIAWVWETRSVNGRNLDLRLRLPDGFESLEAPVRMAFGQALSRGSVTVGLRVARNGGGQGNGAAARVNPAGLDLAIEAVELASEVAARRGLPLAPMTAADLLSVRGVYESDSASPSENPEVMAALAGAVKPLAAKLRAARADEGREVARILTERIDRIAALTAEARVAAEARGAKVAALLRQRVETVLGVAGQVDEARLAQELALIAVKADVTEELDRLEAHVASARRLLGSDEPVGRRFDFLTQEFNRETNTLCAKSGAADLTAIGLEMKVAVDQLREQVQNVE
ncbi:YicC family protein [Amaricoccus solimangrovi]|uniref:YicC family protein n=2 Tax=Amaricoccus solimangrovi TaxID=2589815 RepID=A0A501WFC9_9RHOB|nr:YicC family protein [Amaricoccus solimangrovi]